MDFIILIELNIFLIYNYFDKNKRNKNEIIMEILVEKNKIMQREKYIDMARVLAILSVVLCHSVESVYFTIEWSTLSLSSQVFKIVAYTIGRVGVPIFLFISGALLLRKNIENGEEIKKFYKKNLIPLLITTEIWNVIYYCFLCVYKGNVFNFKIFIETLLFMKSSEAPNMWYMPVILGIYVAIPFISIIVKKFNLKSMLVPIILVFICSVLLPTISIIAQDKTLGSTVLNISFLGGVYGLYVILGYYISSSDFIKKIPKYVICLITIVMLIITVLIQIYLWNMKIKYNIWYNFLPLFILSTIVFIFFKKNENLRINEKIYKIIYTISNQSLAIFFVHIIMRYLLKGFINSINIINPLKVILTFIILLLTSLIVVNILKKIKVIKKYVFLIKDN